MITAMAGLTGAGKLVPSAPFTVIVPGMLLLIGFETLLPTVMVLRYRGDSAYHKHSPLPSRKSLIPRVFHGSRPIIPKLAVHVPLIPVLLVSGHGNTPGMVACPADHPISAALASASAAAVFLSRSILTVFPFKACTM